MNGAIASLTGSVALTAAWFPSIAHAAELTGWQFDPATQQLQLTIPAGTTPRYFLLAQPARIVLDLPNTQVGNVSSQQSFGGAVRQIRVGQFDANSTRIVIELSPDAELTPRQVELQQASSTQWVLRPLLTNGSIAAQPIPSPIAAAPAVPAIAPPVVPPAPPVAIAPAPVAPVLPPSVPSASPPVPAPLPPLEPNAIEIPIAPAALPPAIDPPTATGTAAPFEANVTAIDPTETTVLPSASATSTIALNAPPTPSIRLPDRPAEPDLPARDPILLPPAIDAPVQTAPVQTAPVQTAPAQPLGVQVPPIAPAQPAPVALPPTVQAAAPVAIELPPALSAPVAPSQVTVPPLNSAPPARPPAAPENAAPENNVEFGQPPPVPLTARRSSVLLPAGTVLSLRYPREAAIEIESGHPRQEVLVLQNPIRDAAGETILPAGAQVIGRFEVDRSGSRFVAQAIATGDRNIRLSGASAAVSGDRSNSREDLIVHSALGALALTLLGGFSGLGLLGGAAAGAATTYLDPPNAIVIQPNQVFEVRLTEDVPQ